MFYLKWISIEGSMETNIVKLCIYMLKHILGRVSASDLKRTPEISNVNKYLIKKVFLTQRVSYSTKALFFEILEQQKGLKCCK